MLGQIPKLLFGGDAVEWGGGGAEVNFFEVVGILELEVGWKNPDHSERGDESAAWSALGFIEEDQKARFK